MRTSRATAALILISLALAGCALNRRVAVVTTEPAGCRFVRELAVQQCGGYGPPQPGRALIHQFKREARQAGGNTLQCCRTSDEALVLFGEGVNGGPSCFEFHEQVARVYACPRD
jgi:hypothetical protein